MHRWALTGSYQWFSGQGKPSVTADAGCSGARALASTLRLEGESCHQPALNLPGSCCPDWRGGHCPLNRSTHSQADGKCAARPESGFRVCG